MPSRTALIFPLFLVLSLFLNSPLAQAVRFELPAERNPRPKCIWNFAGAHSLVIVTANVPASSGQRIDIEILDGSDQGNVYLSKRDINGETRLAVTTHESADVGVCLSNHLIDAPGKPSRSVELDIDIGADAVDYNAIANQESLSILEVEMRKLEAMTREVVDELAYLQRREARMRDTNGESRSPLRALLHHTSDGNAVILGAFHDMTKSAWRKGTEESTNERVKYFSVLIMLGIIALGVWQILHLRSFFKKKYLID